MAGEGVVLFGQADLIGCMLDDWQELEANLLAAGFAQVLGRRILAAAENAFGIVNAHLLHGIDQQRLGLRYRSFSRFVHAGFQFVDLGAHAELLHFLGNLAQVARQLDLHVRVVAETARSAQLFDGDLCALGQCVLEPTGGVFLRKITQRQGQRTGGNQQARTQAGEAKGRTEHGSFLNQERELTYCVDANFQRL